MYAASWCSEQQLLKSIGYDRNNLENFLLFWSDLDETDVNDETMIFEKLQKKKTLVPALKFIAKRNRAWQMIVFNDGIGELHKFL